MVRVVITGIGAWSCLGKNVDEVRDSLFAGKSGIGFEQVRKDMGYRSALTGMVETPVLKGLLDRRARVSMGQPAEFAYMATSEALKMANMDPEWIEKQETEVKKLNRTESEIANRLLDRQKENFNRLNFNVDLLNDDDIEIFLVSPGAKLIDPTNCPNSKPSHR